MIKRSFCLSAFALLLGTLSAQEPGNTNYNAYIPSDKDLDAGWVSGLQDRGERRIYSGEELRLIAMPCGGIGAGQMEISGDGRLGTWWIFNVPPPTNAGLGNYNGARYLQPAPIEHTIENGFAISFRDEDGKSRTLRLDGRDFNDIQFVGEYPIAKLSYDNRDKDLPVEISSEVFSPFVPTSVRSSANPVTILRYTVKNESDSRVKIDLGGWMENPSNSDKEDKRINRVFRSERLTGVQFGFKSEQDLSFPDLDVAEPESKYGTGEPDYGNLSLSVLDPGADANAGCSNIEDFLTEPGAKNRNAKKSVFGMDERKYGTVVSTFSLDPGETKTVSFLVSWYYPNLYISFSHWLNKNPGDFVGRMYDNWYNSSADVAKWIADNYSELYGQTELFRATYHETTLPYWLANRISMPVSTLACENITLHRDGRMFAFEGVSFCTGTCGHVYNFVTAIANLFPELERSVRLMQDFNEDFGFDPKTGRINFRGHDGSDPQAEHDYASDAQSGYVLKAYREHLHSADMSFLEEVWPRVKLAMNYQIFRDGAERGLEPNGVLEGKQTFWDPMWWGPNPYNNTLYLAALRAAEEMARLMDEEKLADRYHGIYESGRNWMQENMWNGEYYVHLYPEGKWSSSWNGIVKLEEEQENASAYVHAFGKRDKHYYTSTACDAQQTFGQNWAHQLGLGYILPRESCKSAAASIFKYNWTPDIKSVYDRYPPHNRTLAAAGEGAMVNGAWPREERQAFENTHDKDDIWSGLEYQAACDMINEGLLKEALIMIKAIDERYDPIKRNPWNEIEGAEHYSRAMHSWNVLLTLSGFSYDGPAGKIGFAPRMTPGNFKSFFSTAEGWGFYGQKRSEGVQVCELKLEYGQLNLAEIVLEVPVGTTVHNIVLRTGEDDVKGNFEQEGQQISIKLSEAVNLSAGQSFLIRIE